MTILRNSPMNGLVPDAFKILENIEIVGTEPKLYMFRDNESHSTVYY